MANIVLVLMAPVRIPSPPQPVPIPVTPLHPHLSAHPIRVVCCTDHERAPGIGAHVLARVDPDVAANLYSYLAADLYSYFPPNLAAGSWWLVRKALGRRRHIAYRHIAETDES